MHTKGQIAVEYILAITILIIGLLIFLAPGGKMEEEMEYVMNTQAEDISVMANRIFK